MWISTNMRLSLILLTSLLFAQQPTPIAELDALKLDNASLRLDLLTKEMEAIHAQRNQIIKDICAAAKIELSECSIDPVKRTVSRVKRDK